MRQFLQGSDAAFIDLERRARQACIVFPGQEMPPGTQPAHVRIGFEVNTADNSALLLVDRGVIYTGEQTELAEWLAAGYKWFPNFGKLRQWIRETLAPMYEDVEIQTRFNVTSSLSNVRADLTELTNNKDIQQQGRDPNVSLPLNEDTLFDQLVTHIRGQDPVLRILADRLHRHLARRMPRHPATFWAIGPCGVGKRTTAESLPTILQTLDSAGAGYGYLHLNMANYQEHTQMNLLLGTSQGSVGCGEYAQLGDALSVNPRTVVLIDELEKAHPELLQTLVHLIDTGRLATPTRNQEIDCRFAIFFFTSTLDINPILRELETRDAFDSSSVINEICREHFCVKGIAPELARQISCFLVFQPLTIKVQTEIAALNIVRLAQEYGVQVGHIAPQVIDHLLQKRNDKRFEMQPYEFLVDDLLGNLFAQAALSSKQEPLMIQGEPPFY